MSFLTKERGTKFAIISLVSIVLFATYLIGSTLYVAVKAEYTVTCKDIDIPYTSITRDDVTLDEGDEEVLTGGINGQRQVCTRGSGQVVSDQIKSQPVDEVISHGTRQPESEDDEDYYQEDPVYGSICNDGWHSPSVGRGACSWHGGVAY